MTEPLQRKRTHPAARSDYIELRCRSAFSFLAGAALPEELIERAAALGYPALALGDRDGLYGAPRFHKAAQQAGVRALIGCEITLGERDWQLEADGGRKRPSLPPPAPCPQLYLLAATRTGYQNLCRLLTQAKLRAPKGAAAVTWSDLEGHSDGLICLSGGAGAAAWLAPAPGVTPLIARLRQLFPNRLYLDLQRHLDAGEERINRTLIALAAHSGLPLVATNDVRHATAGERPLLDVLTCIRAQTTLAAAGRRLLKNAERHLKAPGEMAALFGDLPAAVRNTRRIAEQCEFTLADLGYRFPDFPLPAGATPDSYLRALTYAGARERYGRLTQKVCRQLEHELAIIAKLELAGYFLIVWDIVRFCRQQRILVQGRGSAANSAVCYALGITAVDAVGMELLFERFLSEERGEWPDIDLDLPSGTQRERVIQYVYQRYGERGAAMTANVITYRTRSAVRDVGKALGFTMEQVGKLARRLHRFEFRDDADQLPLQLRAGGVDPSAPPVALLVDLVGRLTHLPRHLGQHSGGMVIAAGRLDAVVPLEPATMPGRVVIQWDKDDCADLGIIKVDLLGLGMMAVLEDTIPLVRAHEGVALDLAQLPPNDPTVYAMLQRADTIGVFQVESRAQMATLPRMKPACFYDLVVEVAIIRPGPITGQMVHPYLNRRSGNEPVRYAHPELEPILKRTLGVPLFQEQLLRMAMAVAGFTGGEAEELRRAMGCKRSRQRMQQLEAKLRAGMAAKGITDTAADEIVRSITSFALYGFPESHAASFALLAYASAYLRAHHAAAFTCALLNNWPMGFYHPATIIKDAQRHGVRVLPLDVTRSAWQCTLERETGGGRLAAGAAPQPPASSPVRLRLGLRFAAGLRAEAGQRIAAERARAPFTSVADVVTRGGLRDQEAQTLAHIGAFAAFGLSRRQALWQVTGLPREPLFASSSAVVKVTPAPVFHLPSLISPLSRSPQPPAASPLSEMSPLDRTLADYHGTGLTVGPQIVQHVRAALTRAGVLRAADLVRARPGSWAKVAGLVIVRQRPGTAKGFCFLTLEDETGTANAVITPDLFRQHRALIHTAALLQIEGPVQAMGGVIHVRTRRLTPLALPQQVIQQRAGYRMRTTPHPVSPPLPPSHDFR